jgi:endoglycosylceramidase
MTSPTRIPLTLTAAVVGFASLAGLTGCKGSSGPAGVCSITPPVLPGAVIHTDGQMLVDALGRVVVLRGVDAGGRSKLSPFAPFDFTGAGYDAALAAYLDRAATWGIDALRVPFVWAAVEPTQGTYDMDFLARYDALIDGAFARGMSTVVDFHQDVYADVYCGDGFPDWTIPGPLPAPQDDCPNWGGEYLSDLAVMTAFDRFWASGSTVRAGYDDLWAMMAARYASHPGVIGFEPMNEPGWGSADMTTWEATTLTTFYGQMAASIHAAAPDALIFFDATGVDGTTVETSLALPSGTGLVFAPHYYQYAALQGDAPSVGAVQNAVQRWADQGTTWNVPVLLGEFGASNATPGVPAYIGAHFDALDAVGMSGTEWEYSVSVDLWNGENLSVVNADGTENPAVQAIVRPYPKAIAGSGVVFSYDAASGAMTLHYTPSTGVSEVAIPSRAYPLGYTVQITGGCADASHAEVLLVEADPGASSVEVSVTPRAAEP